MQYKSAYGLCENQNVSKSNTPDMGNLVGKRGSEWALEDIGAVLVLGSLWRYEIELCVCKTLS